MRISTFAALALLGASALSGAAPEAPSSAPRQWSSDVRATFATARQTGHPVLVDLYAGWCTWCKVLEAKVFSTLEFAEATRDYELLRVDVEDGGDGSELAARYGSDSLPTMLILEPSGAQIGQVVGYAETDVFLARIRSAFAVHQRELQSYENALTATDQKIVRSVAIWLYRRNDGDRAAELFSRALGLEGLSVHDRAWSSYYLADSLRLARRFAEARSAQRKAVAAAEGFDDRNLAERLDLLPFWIARDEERCVAASDTLAGFESRHPQSVYLRGARNALERLKSAGDACS